MKLKDRWGLASSRKSLKKRQNLSWAASALSHGKKEEKVG